MKYYKSNAIYDELTKHPQPELLWPHENSWFLVYANREATPKLIAYILGKTAAADTARTKQREITIRNLASKAALPFTKIVFDDTAESISTVLVTTGDTDEQVLSLEGLKNLFETTGLPVISGQCGKAINDAASSAYHIWQRRQLGAITVSDIDLVRIDPRTSDAVEFIELKRSFYELSNWTPFADDYPNFDALVKVAQKADCRFSIAYNRRTKSPWHDDPSLVRIFDYDIKNRANPIGTFSFAEFRAGNY